MFTVWFYITLLFGLTEGAAVCRSSGTTEGFQMSLYHYSYGDLAASDGVCYSNEFDDYYYRIIGYTTYEGGLIGSAKGVTDLTMEFDEPEKCTVTKGKLPSNFNYEDEITISNFTMFFLGYLYADISTTYSIELLSDSAYMHFPSGKSYDCCGNANPNPVPAIGDFDLFGTDKPETFYLEAGIYYPLSLLYVNKDYDSLHFSMYRQGTEPGEPEKVYNKIYDFPFGLVECANDVSYKEESWTESFTTTYSTTSFTSVGSDGYGTIETVYYIQTPDPISSAPSTSSSAPSASSSAPSTSSSAPSASSSAPSTSSSAPSASSSAPSASSSAPSASSSTSSARSSLTSSNGTVSSGTSIKSSESSYLSSTDEPITSNSSKESIDTYTSETSTVSATTTTTVTGTTTVTTECTEGDVTAPTTYSTATVTVTGPDGIATTETTYYVKTPATPSGAATNKYSNGTASRYETVFSTIYSYCSCSDVSIYSTDVVTVTTTNGNGNPEKVVQTNHYVQVPETMTVNADMGSAVAAALASKTTEGSIPKYYPITTGLSTYSGAASGLSNGIFTFAVGLVFAMIVA